MAEEKRPACGARGLVMLGVSIACSLPGLALAQPGDGSWFPPPAPSGKPVEASPPAEPAPSTEPSPPSERPLPPPEPPPAELPAAPAEPPPAAKPTPLGPYFPVTFDAPAREASLQITGPGLPEPVPCSKRCTLALPKGIYFLNIQAYRRKWIVPVSVRQRQSVMVDVPSDEAFGLGLGFTLLGGGIASTAGLVAYVRLFSCKDGSVNARECNGEQFKEEFPYLLAVGGAGLVMAGVGVGLLISTRSPNVDIVPASAARARRGPGTFVGFAPVAAATDPGLVLRTTF